MKITEFDIQALIIQRWWQSAMLIAPNVAECDILMLSVAGYATEFEIKISRSDFRRDSKKFKHELYANAFKARCSPEIYKIPNRFIYVVPAELIRSFEVQCYAGLYYVKAGELSCIKTPPLIHKTKFDIWLKKIARSMNYRYLREAHYLSHKWPAAPVQAQNGENETD